MQDDDASEVRVQSFHDRNSSGRCEMKLLPAKGGASETSDKPGKARRDNP